MAYQLYRNTTLGNSLQESRDELIQTQQVLYKRLSRSSWTIMSTGACQPVKQSLQLEADGMPLDSSAWSRKLQAFFQRPDRASLCRCVALRRRLSAKIL
ncbi:transcription initiation factor IIA subunit 2 [Lates japonicus]|uniref:Transcription initiation factor IIA subunit 2 n=1 Tax=Lates japonicus TaxID=270547 RepID=A0AAD3R5I0_LATJO|nr:transcription initiation factor IIA subunit 2 [Lates japonicus]